MVWANSALTTSPHNLLYYCTGGAECLSHNTNSHCQNSIRSPTKHLLHQTMMSHFSNLRASCVSWFELTVLKPMNYDYLTTATFYVLHIYTARVVLNATPSNHQVCAVRTQLGNNQPSVTQDRTHASMASFLYAQQWLVLNIGSSHPFSL